MTDLTYAVADLHGTFDLLTLALTAIDSHAQARASGSRTIVFLGDYIDRGPQSREILDRLIAGPPEGCSWICLKGNHEDIMWQTLRKPLDPMRWIENGGGHTLVSYGHARTFPFRPEVVPPAHLDWIETLPLMHVDQHRVFVHAGVDKWRALDDQDPERLLWKLYDDRDENGHGDRHVVHGHHQFARGPLLLANRTDLDTYAWHTGRLVVGVFDDARAGGPIDLMPVMRSGAEQRT